MRVPGAVVLREDVAIERVEVAVGVRLAEGEGAERRRSSERRAGARRCARGPSRPAARVAPAAKSARSAGAAWYWKWSATNE